MSRPPEDSWSRPHFQPGGGNASLFFIVHGHFEPELMLSRKRYRSNGVPDGCSLQRYARSESPEPFRIGQDDGYLGQKLREEQPELAKALAACDECMILRGEVRDPKTLEHLRDAIGLVTASLDAGGIAVFDPHQFKWWTADEWRRELFEPNEPRPSRHVVIVTSEEPQSGRTWFHTRGMIQFGRPDLSVHGVPKQLERAVVERAVVERCNRFIELQAFGGVVPEGQPVRMKGIPEGWTCRHLGDVEDPDFNNRHLEIGPLP